MRSELLFRDGIRAPDMNADNITISHPVPEEMPDLVLYVSTGRHEVANDNAGFVSKPLARILDQVRQG